MRARRQRVPLTQQPGRARVQYERLGVVLVIGPWICPVFLSLSPIVAAVAAGNCVVLKPSELAPATSRLLADSLPRYLDPEAVKVVEGDGAVTQDLLSLDFDHALFTGGTEIGRTIMAGAAASLTPVTLEFGGKSPVIVTADADLGVAVRRDRLGEADKLRSDLHCPRLRAGRRVGAGPPGRGVADRDHRAAGRGRRRAEDGQRAAVRPARRLPAGDQGTVVMGGGTDRSALSSSPRCSSTPTPRSPP